MRAQKHLEHLPNIHFLRLLGCRGPAWVSPLSHRTGHRAPEKGTAERGKRNLRIDPAHGADNLSTCGVTGGGSWDPSSM